MENKNYNIAGIYAFLSLFFAFVFVILMILRIYNVITIPWLWVWSPIWLFPCVVITILLFGIVFDIIKNSFKKKYISKDIYND